MNHMNRFNSFLTAVLWMQGKSLQDLQLPGLSDTRVPVDPEKRSIAEKLHLDPGSFLALPADFDDGPDAPWARLLTTLLDLCAVQKDPDLQAIAGYARREMAKMHTGGPKRGAA
ncbi:MAG: hypothetical protein IJ083_08560 [Clostridia bacterium]|nr:hypothetical protein [Clostridia bacterium]